MQKKEENNQNNMNKQNMDLQEWRKSKEYQDVIDIYPVETDATIITKLIKFTKEMDQNKINELLLNNKKIIVKGNTATKFAHENMIILAQMDITKNKLKKTKDIIDYLYKKDSHWFTQNNKNTITKESFLTYYNFHKSYLHLVKKYPGHRYSNMTWHDINKYHPNNLLRIYDDAATLGMMDKNNKLHFMIINENI